MKAARLLVVVLCACSLGRPDRERLGDVAWHDGRWAEAMASYRAAGDSPQLTAKLADAAFEGGLLAESAQAWIRLGTDAPERAPEAAAGLARVAVAAERAGKQAALASAVAGLRRIAPGWPMGRIASRMGGPGTIAPELVADVIPAMLVSSDSRESSEPLLLALGQADRARNACELAVPILEGVLRRSSSPAMHDSATVTLGWCELGLGNSALQAQRAGDAERWYDRASRREPRGAVARRALLGLGDARLAQGDTVAARGTWQSLATAADVPADSLTQFALVRLQALIPGAAPDTGTLHPVRP